MIKSQNYWNPFRDWNMRDVINTPHRCFSLKTTETLLGIETDS